MKILFLAKSPDATKYYRCDVPAKYLKLAGHDVRVDYCEPFTKHGSKGIQEADVEWADVIVFQRPITIFALQILEVIKKATPNKIIVGEYDDDYFNVPEWNPGYRFIKANEKYWPQFFKLYDGVIASTEPLKKVLEKHITSPIKVIQNAFDYEDLDSDPVNENCTISSPRVGEANKLAANFQVNTEEFNALMANRVVICWAGSRFHYMDLDMIVGDMVQACKMDDDIVFLFVGYTQGNVVRSMPINKFFVGSGKSPVHKFYTMLRGIRMDAYIAPLAPNIFNQSKSDLKLMEASALGAIPIVSNWDPYENSQLDVLHVNYEKNDWRNAFLQISEIVKAGKKSDIVGFNRELGGKIYDPRSRVQEYISFFEELRK